MPADVYLKTTNYPARPYAGPRILHTPQLVPQACSSTLTDYSIMVLMVGPSGGKGRVRREAETRGPLALPLTLGCAPPCLPLPAPSLEGSGSGCCFPVPRHTAQPFRKPQRGRGHCSAMPQGLGTGLTSWHPLLPQCLSFLLIQVLPHSPSWAGRGHFHSQTHLSQPSTPSLPPRPEKG